MEGNTAGDAMPCGAVVRRMLLEGLAVAESIEDGWPLGGSTSKSCSPREWLIGPKIVVRRVSLLAVVGSACGYPKHGSGLGMPCLPPSRGERASPVFTSRLSQTSPNGVRADVAGRQSVLAVVRQASSGQAHRR